MVQSFAGNGVTYHHSHIDRSTIYANAVPLFTSGRTRLLDNRKLVGQLAALERRTTATRDKIDHPRGARDDLANAAAGALVAAADRRNEVKVVGGWGVVTAADLKGLNPAPRVGVIRIRQAPAGGGSIIPGGDHEFPLLGVKRT